jgi:hypothetical protein
MAQGPCFFLAELFFFVLAFTVFLAVALAQVRQF